MYCLCTRCIIVNSVQVRCEFGKFAYTAICMRKCTLWSDNTCVFTRFHSVKNANTQLIWSSVGPLFFFIIFINDIVTEIHSSIKLFADDTSLYAIVDNLRESAITLNNDMATIHAWSTKWLVNFNPQKTEIWRSLERLTNLFIRPL